MRVFVYGTLQAGHRNAHVNTGRRVPGRFVTAVALPLYVIGPAFLPWLLERPGEGEPVEGELYEVDDAGLVRLDALERIDVPDWYRRGRVQLRALGAPDAEPCEAMVYFGSAERLARETVHAGPLPAYTLALAARFAALAPPRPDLP